MSGQAHDDLNRQPWAVEVRDGSCYLFVGYHDSVLAFQVSGTAESLLILNRPAAAALADAVDTLLAHPALRGWQQPHGWTSTPGPDDTRCVTGSVVVKYLDEPAGEAGALEVRHASLAGLGAAARAA